MSPWHQHIEHRARRTHVADIRNPLVKAIWWHRYAQRCEANAGPFSSDPEVRAARDEDLHEAIEAASRCDDILAQLRSSRELSRLSDSHANSNGTVAA